MKKLFLAATLAFAGLTAVHAQETTTSNTETTEQTAQADSTAKTPVKLEELPAPIQEALKSDAFKDWTPSAAFLVKDEKGEYYQVDAKKENEEASLKFDKDGKPL